jgi:hypothetical protein
MNYWVMSDTAIFLFKICGTLAGLSLAVGSITLVIELWR